MAAKPKARPKQTHLETETTKEALAKEVWTLRNRKKLIEDQLKGTKKEPGPETRLMQLLGEGQSVMLHDSVIGPHGYKKIPNTRKEHDLEAIEATGLLPEFEKAQRALEKAEERMAQFEDMKKSFPSGGYKLQPVTKESEE